MNKLLSLCMIVKNEEVFLERCLKSVHQIVDEIIIVDTGSTDRTKEIAAKYTNNVHDFEWINDFSAARNESLKHATGKWILIMDADEYMDVKDIQGLREFLSKEKPSDNKIYQIVIRNFLGNQSRSTINEAPVLRVFANRLGFKYHRAVHEQPQQTKGIPLQIVTLPFYILHSGYLDQVVEEKGKHQRNLSIFDEMKAKSNLSPYDHSMIGVQLTMMHKNEEAMEHLQLALKLGNKKSEWYRYNLLSILEIHLRQDNPIETWNFIEEHLALYTHYPDIMCIRGILLSSFGFRDLAKKEFLAAYQEAEKRSAQGKDITVTNPDLGMRMPLWQLATMCERENNFNQCIHYLTKLLMANDKDMKALIKMVEILSLNESTTNIVTFLDKLLDINHDPVKAITLGKIAISLGNRELARHFVAYSPNRDQYSISDRLRYALLTNDSIDFELILQTSSRNELEEHLLKLIACGSIAWSRPEWLLPYLETSNDKGNEFIHFATAVLNKQNAPDEDAQFEYTAFETLSQLYIYQQWEAFDTLIELYNSSKLINKLANFFLSKHYTTPALQYYQHLLDNGQLIAESCENLAFLQTIDGHIADALAFWEHAIELKPDTARLYIQYCVHCKDTEARSIMKSKLLEKHPEYASLSLFQNL